MIIKKKAALIAGQHHVSVKFAYLPVRIQFNGDDIWIWLESYIETSKVFDLGRGSRLFQDSRHLIKETYSSQIDQWLENSRMTKSTRRFLLKALKSRMGAINTPL